MATSLHSLKKSAKEQSLRLLNKDQLRRLLAEVGTYYSEDDNKELLVQTAMRLPLHITVMVECDLDKDSNRRVPHESDRR